jgi:signal peptide peptidase SppA
MPNTYPHVLSFAISHPWAIQREMLSVIAGILARHVAGEAIDHAALEAAMVNRKSLPQPKRGAVAVIPVHGVLAPRMNMMSEMSGGATYEQLSGQLREAMAMSDVKTVLLDIDSPGGSVAGATELAREILAARTRKPIIAQIQYTGASAAYWLASAATEIIAAPSAQVGSVGVYAAHDDISEALAKVGVKRTYISAGKGKTDGNESEPLSEQALARITASVDESYTRFVNDIVLGRGQGVTAKAIRNDWGAHVYGAVEALSMGMIDKIGTMDETLARFAQAASPSALTASMGGTLQEPARATNQDLTSESDLERAVFELSLSLTGVGK